MMKKNGNQILGDKNPTNFNGKPTKFLRELYHVNECSSNHKDVDTQDSDALYPAVPFCISTAANTLFFLFHYFFINFSSMIIVRKNHKNKSLSLISEANTMYYFQSRFCKSYLTNKTM